MRPSITTLFLLVLSGALFTGCKERNEQAPGAASVAHKHSKAAGATADNCPAHNAPKEVCFICDASLREKGRLWCKEHARYEDRCWLCHPELQDKKRLYCEEHGLYEDECFICHPEVRPSTATPSQAQGLMCGEHGVLEAECGVCHPDMIAQLEPGQAMKVRLPAAASATMAGLKLGHAEEGSLGDAIEGPAEITFNQNKMAQITAPVGGILKSVEADLGTRVTEQQTVARIWSAKIAETVAKAVLTHQNLERERRLRAQNVTSERDLQHAEAEHRAAFQQARTLGFSAEQIEAFGRNPEEPVMLEVRAPFAGEIIDRWAVNGVLVEEGKPLFSVADRTTMWAMVSVPEAALGKIREGQSVELRLGSQPAPVMTGQVTWVAARVDERTRMAMARVEVANPDGVLRANMFARARILTGGGEGSAIIPASAVQKVDGRPVVFVKLAEDLFEARAVRIGARMDGKVAVQEGVTAGEQLVLAGGFPLKSQLLISRLGVGCADE